MPNNKVLTRKRILIAAGIFGVGSLLGVAATQTAIAGIPQTELESQSEAVAAWAPATTKLGFDLPPGVSWPKSAPAIMKEFEVYEEGFAEGVSALYWMCAWETELLEANASSDRPAAEAALLTLQTFAKDPRAAEVLQGVEVWSSNVLTPAAAGDLKPLEQDAATLCVGFPEIGGTR